MGHRCQLIMWSTLSQEPDACCHKSFRGHGSIGIALFNNQIQRKIHDPTHQHLQLHVSKPQPLIRRNLILCCPVHASSPTENTQSPLFSRTFTFTFTFTYARDEHE